MSDLIGRLQESIADAAVYETCAIVPLPELRWAVDEITRLREENARLREDAERLDWLSKNPREGTIRVGLEFKTVEFWGVAAATGVGLRSAIDAAMREAK